MIKINDIKLPVMHTEQDLRNKIIRILNLRHIDNNMPDFEYKIVRRSIDARKKPDIFYNYSVTVTLSENTEEEILHKTGWYDEQKNRENKGNKNKNYTKENSNYNNKKELKQNINNKTKNAYNINKNNKIAKNSRGNKYKIEKYAPVTYVPKTNVAKKSKLPPVIVGAGPAGLFCGLILAYAGFKPIIIERGDCVENRIKNVNDFWLTGSLNKNTNVQFGEGGAGTFSDGKLNTGVKDSRGLNQFVLDTFVKFGANTECAYDFMPHVGTDKLAEVVKNIRNEIIDHGGRVLNLTKMTKVVMSDNRINSIIIEAGSAKNEFPCNDLILAIGHSARDTFRMLYDNNIPMQQKNFAVGLRVQHPQDFINKIQYGNDYKERFNDSLPPATYKLTNKTKDGRAVFSFCMCPGGYVVNASSEEGMLCVNGMSNEKRDSNNANSAIIVSVTKDDFEDDNVFSGMKFQEKLEKKAYIAGKGCIPVQSYGDFCDNKVSENIDESKLSFKGKIKPANLREVLPENISSSIIESMQKFGYTMKGFDDKGAVFAGVESRTSSPVRILRDENFESSIKGIYPCGEGAGYAGGIMSAAIDGIKVAEAIIKKYNK